jgi:hypothetical protein
MPSRDSGYSSGVPAAPGRSAMLEGIQAAGGLKALKKVDRTQIRDRSAALPAGGDSGTTAGGAPAGSPGGGGMADALALALKKRKEKVSRSDDEAEDDDW